MKETKEPQRRFGVYLRCSTQKQDLLMQMSAIEKWIKALPLEESPTSTRLFQDEGRSGADNGRPGFQTLMAAAKNGEIDTIVVYRLDRFTRSTFTAIRSIMDLDQMGVAFVATSQPVLHLTKGSPFRMTMMAAFAEIAEIERVTIVSRVREGLEAAKRRGQKLGNRGVPPRKVAKIKELYELGFSKTDIGRQLQLHRKTVWKVLKQEEHRHRHDA
jgi:DNA invertase Pin-like site-specific DNA recombinase